MTPSTQPPISCQVSVRFVSLLRDGELSASQRSDLDRHVMTCPQCQTARAQFDRLYSGLDTLLAREPISAEPNLSPSPETSHPVIGRRQWLGWMGGATSIGALLGVGAGFWWANASLQSAQTPQAEGFARRIAQYQALYIRDTAQGPLLRPEDMQSVLQQWRQHTEQAQHIQAPPDLRHHHLQLLRVQRLSLQMRAVLQLVYLPTQGDPVALCGMRHVAIEPSESAPQHFSEENMRGVHWNDRNLLWVLVAPQATWSSQALTALQLDIAQQLLAPEQVAAVSRTQLQV